MNTQSWIIALGLDAQAVLPQNDRRPVDGGTAWMMGTPKRSWSYGNDHLAIIEGLMLGPDNRTVAQAQAITPERAIGGNFAALQVQDGTLTAWCDGGESRNLFYAHQGRNLLVSNDLAALARLINPGVDRSALYGFLRYGYINTGRSTFFKGISKLKAFEKLDGRLDGALSLSHWHVPAVAERPLSRDEALDEAQHILSQATLGAVRACQAPMLTLTSGVDSNLIRHLLQRGNIDVPTITHVFSHQIYDEFRHVGQSVPLTEKNMKVIAFDDCLSNLVGVIGAIGQPVNGLNSVGATYTHRFIADYGCDAIITGTGDDIWFSLTREIAAKLARSTARAFTGDGATLSASDYLSADFIGSMQSYAPDFQSPPTQAQSLLKKTMTDNFFVLKSPHIAIDHAACATVNGLDVISPFLDKRVIDFTFGLAEDALHFDDRPKTLAAVMLDRFHQSRFPKGIKMNTPQRELLRGTYKNAIIGLIQDSKLCDNGYIDKNKLLTTYLNWTAESELGNSYFVWKFIVSEIWYRIYNGYKVNNLYPVYN